MTVIDPGGAGGMAPFAIAAVLIVMVYAGGHISGAPYNPAATLAIFLSRKCPASDVVPYMAAQLIAGGAAAGAVLFMKDGAVIVPVTIEIVPALIAEFLFTFALCYVILNVATANSTAGNSYFGLAIGLTVLAGALAVGPVSGGAFNPAVALGLGVMGLVEWGDLWVHLVAEIAGGIAAAGAFRTLANETAAA